MTTDYHTTHGTHSRHRFLNSGTSWAAWKLSTFKYAYEVWKQKHYHPEQHRF